MPLICSSKSAGAKTLTAGSKKSPAALSFRKEYGITLSDPLRLANGISEQTGLANGLTNRLSWISEQLL
jgi:hypothetical protein